MAGKAGRADDWTEASTRSTRARGIAVAVIAHALVVVVTLTQPSAWHRPTFESRPIGVRLLDEAPALPDAPALPVPAARRPLLPVASIPEVPMPEVHVARADPAPTIVAQPVAPTIAVDVAPAPRSAPAAKPDDVPPAAPAPPRTASPHSIDITQVRYLRAPEPAYPLAARRAHEEGRVDVRVLVDAGGAPQQAIVQRSSGFERLDEAALAAVRAARFVPYAEDGIARAFWVVVPLIFELDT